MPSDEQMQKDLKYLANKNAALDVDVKRTDIAWKKRAINFMDYRTKLEKWKFGLLFVTAIVALFFQIVTTFFQERAVTTDDRITTQYQI